MVAFMAENNREIILDMLLEMEKEKTFSSKLLKAVLDKYDYLQVQDKAFIKRVTEGTIERRIEIDYYLNQFSTVPVGKMKPLIRNLLRMSVYQLLYMDAVPDSAVCNEACKLATKRKFVNLKGFVNAVLRKIAAQKDSLPAPEREADATLYLAVTYSCPVWLVELWCKEWGQEITEQILRGLLEIHPVTLRFSTRLTKEERERAVRAIEASGVQLTRSPYLDYVYTAEHVVGVQELPGFDQGLFTVQDCSSALAVRAAGLKSTDVVVDVCAAPGGKSILAAEQAKLVYSRDLSQGKCDLIAENVERMSLSNVRIQVQDATVYDETLENCADVLILDVPCSGLGVMGKKRDIKYHASKEGLKELVALQRQIVKTCYRYVKPGGILLYSTCTIHRAENEAMVQWILQELPFVGEDLTTVLPATLLEEQKKVKELCATKDEVTTEVHECSIQLLPGYMSTDGFFFARLRRKEEHV